MPDARTAIAIAASGDIAATDAAITKTFRGCCALLRRDLGITDGRVEVDGVAFS